MMMAEGFVRVCIENKRNATHPAVDLRNNADIEKLMLPT
jgi:hypothetical protein